MANAIEEPNPDRRKRNLVPILSDVSKSLSPDNVRRFYSAAFEHLTADIFREQRELRMSIDELKDLLINVTCPTEFVCDFSIADLGPMFDYSNLAWDDPARPKDVLTLMVWCWRQAPLATCIAIFLYTFMTLDQIKANDLAKKYGVELTTGQQVIKAEKIINSTILKF